MKHFVIAIDGPAGAGKGTIAKLVAKELGFLYIDTGAMYRAFTLKALQEKIPFDNQNRLIQMAENTRIVLLDNETFKIYMDDADVTKDIRTEEVSSNSHFVASIYEIREILWDIQREYRKSRNIVMEGRDIGSIVFPDAQLKIYLDAMVEERARRRYIQLREQGIEGNLAKIGQEIIERDRKDVNRKIAPLLKLPDAIHIDSTNMTVKDEVDYIIQLYRERKDS